MIDSHCHLNFDILQKNFTEIINNAKKNNITCILSINTKLDEFHQHYSLIRKYKSIYISNGVHPDNISNNYIPSIDDLKKNCSNDRVIGVGETGIDLYHSDKNLSAQVKAFENHIQCSYETNLPLIIHQRNSENEIIDILNNYKNLTSLKVVFHCFSGSEKLRDFCIDNNYYISLSGIITFKNAENLREIIRVVPQNLILLETDSPFLTPSPFRGVKPNQPLYILYIGKYLSNFFNLSLEKFEEITNNNFYSLFTKAIRYKEILYED